MNNKAIIRKAMMKVRAAILRKDLISAINELAIAFEALEAQVFEKEEKQ